MKTMLDTIIVTTCAIITIISYITCKATGAIL